MLWGGCGDVGSKVAFDGGHLVTAQVVFGLDGRQQISRIAQHDSLFKQRGIFLQASSHLGLGEGGIGKIGRFPLRNR